MDWQKVRELFIRYLAELLQEYQQDADKLYSLILEKLSKELTITPELEAKIKEFFQQFNLSLLKEIYNVIEVAMLKGTGKMPSDEVIKELAGQVIEYRYPDGLNLSQRLWAWEAQARVELRQVIVTLSRQSVSAQHMLYQLQYALENIHRQEFVITLLEDLPSYLKNTVSAAKTFQDAQLQKATERALKKVQKLQTTHNIANAKQLIKELQKAVKEGQEKLIQRAVFWWVYNRQLYRLSTIARTELANAFHLAQIRATEEDEDIIGYRWMLSPSHPRPDICDVYATMDYGLGRGIHPKDKVPRHKLHPHCLCYLIPVLKRKNMKEKDQPDIDRQVLYSFAPKWIRRRVDQGEDILKFWDMQRGKFLTQEEIRRLEGEMGEGEL